LEIRKYGAEIFKIGVSPHKIGRQDFCTACLRWLTQGLETIWALAWWRKFLDKIIQGTIHNPFDIVNLSLVEQSASRLNLSEYCQKIYDGENDTLRFKPIRVKKGTVVRIYVPAFQLYALIANIGGTFGTLLKNIAGSLKIIDSIVRVACSLSHISEFQAFQFGKIVIDQILIEGIVCKSIILYGGGMKKYKGSQGKEAGIKGVAHFWLWRGLPTVQEPQIGSETSSSSGKGCTL
uniref:Uncharacterized protein n=1 Tax=Romanomermis culicivorax TaxID=13658 RepID=A0A915I3R7_ROMCU